MFKNKTALFILTLFVIVAVFATSQVIAFRSIESATKSDEAARGEIDRLEMTIETLESALEDSNKEIKDNEEQIKNNEEQIKKYQDILNAWKNSTNNVNEAVSRILSAYDEVLGKECLFSAENLDGVEDKMMDAVYGAIRSTTPLDIAKKFEGEISELVKLRFDKIVESKIEKIEKNGINYPEDESAAKELKEYCEDLFKNEDVLAQFKEIGLDAKLEEVFAALENAKKDYEYRSALIDAIREQIDFLYAADPDVTHEEITNLDEKVDELLSLSQPIESLNTQTTNYVELLALVRLLPYKNEAFSEVKSLYDTYYAKANGNRELIIALVDIKDAYLNAIEKSMTVEEIDALVEETRTKFISCFN